MYVSDEGVWSMLRGHLNRIGPSTKAEWMHQPLLWMRLSASTRDKLYEDLGKFKNGRKMLDLVNTVVNSFPINDGEEGEWSGQCDDRGKIINAKGLGKDGKIIQLGSIDEVASWRPIRIVARDSKKWKVNPSVVEVEEDWMLYAVEDKPLECLEWDPAEYKWNGEQNK